MLYTAVILLAAACRWVQKDDTRAFMPGMYVRTIDHEFARGSDTLIIRQLKDNTYEIIKRSGMAPVRNGKVLPFQHRHETWTGIYSEQDQVIHEQKKGKVLSFVPGENKLLVGASAYRKVKQ